MNVEGTRSLPLCRTLTLKGLILLMIETLHYLKDPGNYGMFLIMCNAGFISSTVF